MKETWGATDVGRVPLFERLVDDNPHQRQEPVPRRSYDRDGLRGSIRRELARVLGSRCPVAGDVALARERTVLDYGLPDLEEGGRATVREDRLRLARLIRQTVEAYEPRLQRVEVEVEERADGGARLLAVIRAVLVTERVREPLNFTLPIGGEGGARAR